MTHAEFTLSSLAFTPDTLLFFICILHIVQVIFSIDSDYVVFSSWVSPFLVLLSLICFFSFSFHFCTFPLTGLCHTYVCSGFLMQYPRLRPCSHKALHPIPSASPVAFHPNTHTPIHAEQRGKEKKRLKYALVRIKSIFGGGLKEDFIVISTNASLCERPVQLTLYITLNALDELNMLN